MKFWNRLAVAVMALLFAMSLGLGQSLAAEKSKKKKKEEKHEMMVMKHHESYTGGPIEGLNLAGKPGYFISDDASVLRQGQIAGSAHLTFDSWGSALQVPFGASFGITDKLMVNVNTSFFTATGESGLNFLGFGAKYGFGQLGNVKNLNIAAGVDFAVGPLSNSLGSGVFSFDPYGVVTYTFVDGLQLNGKLGLEIQTYSFGGFSGSYSFFQLDLGAAYPFDKDLTGIAELATNGVVYGTNVGGTPLLVGIRTGHDVQFQAFGGLDLGGQVGLFVGGGISLFSE